MMVVFVVMKDQGGCCWHSYPSISSLAIDSGNGENSGGGGDCLENDYLLFD